MCTAISCSRFISLIRLATACIPVKAAWTRKKHKKDSTLWGLHGLGMQINQMTKLNCLCKAWLGESAWCSAKARQLKLVWAMHQTSCLLIPARKADCPHLRSQQKAERDHPGANMGLAEVVVVVWLLRKHNNHMPNGMWMRTAAAHHLRKTEKRPNTIRLCGTHSHLLLTSTTRSSLSSKQFEQCLWSSCKHQASSMSISTEK